MNATAANLPPEESEVTLAQLTEVPSKIIRVPGLAEAKIRMECELEQAVALGGTPEKPASDLIIGKVVCFHIAEELYEDGRIDAAKLKPLSRLAGHDYATLGNMITLERPD